MMPVRVWCLLILSELLRVVSWPALAWAQVLPDATLGDESSRPVTAASVQGQPATLIQGGATRGVNLFHSFAQFNVAEGQRVYFANPAGIDTILSRVTGTNPSRILGTLGVDGRANLLLLNPNGVIFGAQARLDVTGSLLVSTADRFIFANNTEFSATQPQAAPLLTVNVLPGLQWGRPQGTISSRGNLAAGGDLTLTANQLDLQGQLRAERDLTLYAQDQVYIRDTPTEPFLARSGRHLTIQGDRMIDILALNHLSQTPFVSGDDLRLISDGDISADAHFASRGDFAVVQRSGAPGSLVSRYDPIISASGNVTFGNYTGVALKVEATGSITGGDITITGPDVGLVGVDPDIAILTSSPAVILRAGVNALTNPANTPQTTGGTTFVSALPASTPAGITVGSIRTSSGTSSGGTVILTAPGDIAVGTGGIESVSALAGGNGGNVTLSSSTGQISINGTVNAASLSLSGVGSGGQLTFTAAGDITLQDLNSWTNGTGSAGSVQLISGGSVISSLGLEAVAFSGTQGGDVLINAVGNVDIEAIDTRSSGNAGRVEVISGRSVSVASGISTNSFAGQGGNARIEAVEDVAVTAIDTVSPGNAGRVEVISGRSISVLSTTTFSSGQSGGAVNFLAASDITTGSIDSGSGSGQGGDITMTSTGGAITTTGLVRSDSIFGGAGRITLTASGLITTDSLSSFTTGNQDGGNITIASDTGFVMIGERIDSATGGSGRAGDVSIRANSVSLQDSTIFSSALSSGRAGNVAIQAGTVTLTRANAISGSAGSGRGGDVTIQADAISFQESFITSGSAGSGAAGNITLQGAVVDLLDGTGLAAGTTGSGAGGNLTVTATNTLSISGTSPTGAFSQMGTNTFGLGDAGNVLVMAGRVVLRDGAVISSTTGDFGSPGLPAGLGGSLTINADVVDVQGISPNGRSPSRIATSTFSPSDAGTLTVNARQVLLQEGGILATSSFSSGRAGDLIVNAGESVTLRGVATIPTGEVPSALSSDTFSENGRAGNLTVNTQRLTVADGAAVSVSTFGSNPGGTLTVNASRDISLSGTSADGFASGLYAQTFNRGNAGNLVVATDALQVSDRATLTVASGSIAGARLQRAVLGSILPTFPLPADPAPQDRGAAGNLLATIRSLSLDRGGQVLASTDSGQGGNLSLTVQDGILMRRGSLISATAGTEAAGGDGGNITINTPFLVTIPQENNDIIANAFSGQGGRVDITAQSIFFFTLRSRDDLVRLLGTTNPSELTPRRLPTNDISAISQQNPTLNGVVSLNTLGVDPSQGLVALPTNLVDPSQLVSQACKPQGNRASSLVSTGRGGLPENPTEALMDDSAIAPWVTPSAPRPTGDAPQAPVPQSRIVEISYWTHHPDGAIELVAISSQQPTRQSFTGCPQGN